MDTPAAPDQPASSPLRNRSSRSAPRSGDPASHSHFNDELQTRGGLPDGRSTYDLVADFWPAPDQDPCSPAPMVEFAGIWRDMPKIVYSRTLTSAGWNTKAVHDVVAEEVLRLKRRPDGDLALGGAEGR